MSVYIYKLRFKGPTHFGETGIDLENVTEWVNSDTFFSAMMNAMSEFMGRDSVSRFIDRFMDVPPFLISSLFLYKDDTYFLPRPLDDTGISNELKKRKGKELKKIKWLDPEGFVAWLDGNLEGEIDRMGKLQQRYRDSFKREIRPRVTLDRRTQNSTLYHCGYVYFKEDAGLYGFVAFNDTSQIEQFHRLLKLLGKIGLGGERTYGCGVFEIETFEEVSGVLKELIEYEADRYVLLSLFHPSEKESSQLEGSLLAYDVIRKRGWITSGRYALPFKRKSVGFITEGSVLLRQPVGSMVDATPNNGQGMLDHKVFRYGYAFTIPYRSKK